MDARRSTVGSFAAAGVTRLLRPRSIAVIGGEAAARVAEQCDRMGFDGNLWPVHPSRKTVAGRRAFHSIDMLPGVPDAAFVGVNRHATIAAVAALSRMGAGGAVCYASGFLEAADGELLQRDLVDAAGSMPIIGPNCYGFINFLDGAPLWPDQHGGRRLEPSERGVAIITQSSNIAISMTMQQRALPIAYLLTAGNQAQLGVSRIALALLEDERVSAVGLHIEAFDSAAGFEALSRCARERGVPVVAMKTGRSAKGRTATLSHTASIAGSDAGAEAFLRRLGFARADGIPELLETLKLLHVHGALGGSRIGAMCCSGGEATVLADAAEDAEATFPDLAPGHAAALDATVHPLVTVSNPFDYHTFSWGDEEALIRTFTAFARGRFDATLLMLDFPRADRCDDTDWQTTLNAFAAAMGATQSKGIIAAALGENLSEARATEMIARGIAPLAGVRETLAAIDSAAAIGAAWRSPAPAQLLESRCAPSQPIVLDEAASKALLAASGVQVPASGVARDEDAAVAVAESLGGVVAVKALGIAHKTERGAVRLGLSESREIRQATRELLALGDAVLIERFYPEMVAELLVGLARDPQLGLLLTIGSGGTLVELLADSVSLLLPVSEGEVRDALAKLRLAPLLDGHRNQQAADKDAAVAAILAIARFAIEHRHVLEEVDVNPLGVGPKGRGAVALDALIRTRVQTAMGKEIEA